MLTYEETSRFADADGVRVHYHEAGEGPPLLMIHGGAPGAFGWGNFGRNLEELSKTFRTVIVDLPGYGRSDKPDAPDAPDAPGGPGGRNQLYADVMTAFIERTGLGRPHILGMATGGAAAIKMAADRPECVDKLILVSSAGGHTMFHTPPLTAPHRDYYTGDGPSREKMRGYLEYIVHDHSLITDEILDERYEASVAPEFMARAPEGKGGKSNIPDDLWTRLGAITARTLIIWGRENRIQPFENAVFMLSRIKHSQLHVFGECGLWVPYEKEAEFNALVTDFLQR